MAVGGAHRPFLPAEAVAECYVALREDVEACAAHNTGKLPTHHESGQDFASLVQETFPPFLVAGLGMVGAGILLGHVKHLAVFQEVGELLILVPPLLGLKGNLEMTLASRLSTHANLGHLDSKDVFFDIAVGNLAAVQCQAIIVGFLAAVVACALNLFTTGDMNLSHLSLMAASSVGAASWASLLLALIMIGIIVFSRRMGVDPDNIASPIAGMLGDLVTLSILSTISFFLYSTQEDYWWLQFAVLGGYALVAPLCCMIASRIEYTAEVVKEGWVPVIAAMLISSAGGTILKHADKVFRNLAPFAPVMNGAGGNLAAVQTSRICTDLHLNGEPGHAVLRRKLLAVEKHVPEEEELEPLTPPATLTGLMSSNEHAGVARVLICLTIPGSLIFASLIVRVQSGGVAFPKPCFLALFIGAALVQVAFLILFAHGIVNRLWLNGSNPDNSAIPYVTSLGDVVGTTCLTGAFCLLAWLGGAPFTIEGMP